jgi:hypothetical protein
MKSSKNVHCTAPQSKKKAKDKNETLDLSFSDKKPIKRNIK